MSTKPTHTIKAMDRHNKKNHGRVGVAWLNKDGSISIHLNPGITLSWNDGLMITAFESDHKSKAPSADLEDYS